MNYHVPYLVVLCLILVNFCNAQIAEKHLEGRVLSEETGKPITFVTLITSNSGAITNSDGYFSIELENSDTIIFTHVNYHRIQFHASTLSGDSIQIFLKPKTIILHGITISDIPTEEEFKSNVLQFRIVPSTNEVNAKINFEHTNLIFLSGYTPPMNSMDNYKNYLKGPQPFSIFSTDKTKGIIGFINSIKKPKIKPKFRINNFDSLLPFYESDSTQISQ